MGADSSQAIRLEYAIVAFVDILGFRAMVERDAKPGSPQHLPAILEALDELEGTDLAADLSVTQFSDSVILTAPFSPEYFLNILVAVRDLQCLFVRRSISVRGGIAFGYHFERAGRMFSDALVRAYEIETGVARFPRVVVDRNVLDAALHHPNKTEAIKARAIESLMRDRDGHAFVHYLGPGLVESHRLLIQNALLRAQHGDASLLEKAHWQADYHSHVCDTLGAGGLDAQYQERFAAFEV